MNFQDYVCTIILVLYCIHICNFAKYYNRLILVNMNQENIITQLDKNINRSSALETLMQVDGILEDLNIYAYKNWIEGEIVDGPHIKKYMVTVTFMYSKKNMPDPDAIPRLESNDIAVKMEKSKLKDVAKLVTPDDIETPDGPDGLRPGQSKTKTVMKPIWLVTLAIPRKYMDGLSAGKIRIDDMSIDSADVEAAYDQGLGDDDAIRT